MTPKEFKGQNVIFGEDQPQYMPLPALKLSDGQVITCWAFTEDELKIISENRCIYLSQLTFNHPLQPIRPMAELGDNIEFL